MSPDALIFFATVGAQLFFTGLLIWIVARRVPKRVRLYRFVAPVPVPFFCGGMAVFAFLNWPGRQMLASSTETGILARMVIGYLVLWLVGVLWASMVARWTQR
ncbi:hypothetical protein HZF05_19630 [Sphingomonas sp. CGMCC 1.13654]|uniref:Uncharacterized protein n=1 Tax=Sphingomonas chungangi TaxID=2683589 RepID=A0A838LCD4_9SPHN|nr:hypothetical protein [Sphingomonas chungangi]MBA2936299.1 hypothetical protein [Sphingomonas chungangi]MVW55684.1 hypothetical protein [Sphingomonas chungangi]